MATRKKKADAKPKPAKTEAAMVGTIAPNKLKALLRASKKTKEQTSALSGELGQMVANAVENDHLHRKAFSFTKQLHQMPDEKLAECMAHLMFYLDAAGINERVEKVGRLDLGDGPGEGEEDPKPESNVTALRDAE